MDDPTVAVIEEPEPRPESPRELLEQLREELRLAISALHAEVRSCREAIERPPVVAAMETSADVPPRRESVWFRPIGERDDG